MFTLNKRIVTYTFHPPVLIQDMFLRQFPTGWLLDYEETALTIISSLRGRQSIKATLSIKATPLIWLTISS